jgi:hypothetical protein
MRERAPRTVCCIRCSSEISDAEGGQLSRTAHRILKRKKPAFSAVRHGIFEETKGSLLLAHFMGDLVCRSSGAGTHCAALYYKYFAATRQGVFGSEVGAMRAGWSKASDQLLLASLH